MSKIVVVLLPMLLHEQNYSTHHGSDGPERRSAESPGDALQHLQLLGILLIEGLSG